MLLTTITKSNIMRTKTTIDTNLTVTEIMTKYKIARATAWRAKQSGYFFGSTYHSRDDCRATDAQTRRFLATCSSPGLRISALKSIGRRKHADILAGKSSLTCKEWKAFGKEIAELKLSLRAFVKHPCMTTLRTQVIDHALIKYNTLFKNWSALGRISNGLNAYEDEITEAKNIVVTFISNLRT